MKSNPIFDVFVDENEREIVLNTTSTISVRSDLGVFRRLQNPTSTDTQTPLLPTPSQPSFICPYVLRLHDSFMLLSFIQAELPISVVLSNANYNNHPIKNWIYFSTRSA